MHHLPHLISDLGFILATAAIVTLLFKKLKQPVVLGYLIAGFIVGPHSSFAPTIKDTHSISIWAEIGVIFMLFGLGLEFSFKKLTKVGKSASITAVFEILFMLGLGYVVGQFLGWSAMDSLFLGGILSISSTTIIVRAFDELGLKGKSFVSLVFGVLIVEDLIAILLLVLLSSVAVTQSLSGTELIYSSLKLAFFLVLWFLLGIYLLPLFLKAIKPLLSDETTLIVSIALCLMMVVFASAVGFSPALGAFVMGSILAETREGHRIEHLLVPVKDLFSAVFFVSVGMLINFSVIREHFLTILLITVLTVFGKFLSSGFGALVSGKNLKTSVQTGLSLSQIGEFSFIIATLGMTLKVTSPFLYPIAVAVSAITTFTTPYLIRYSDSIYEVIDRRVSTNFKARLERYQGTMVTVSGRSIAELVWQEYGIKTVLNTVIVVAIAVLMGNVLFPYVAENFGTRFQDLFWLHLTFCALTLILAAPFLWVIFMGTPSRVSQSSREVLAQLTKLQFGISTVRFILGALLTGFIVSHFMSVLAPSGVIFIFITSASAFLFSRFSEPFYLKIEKRFIENLTENERAELEQKAKKPELAPWNATLEEFTVSPESPLCAEELQTSRIKENFGVTIAMIKRGRRNILAPTRTEMLLPGDKVFLIGTDEQLSLAKSAIEFEGDAVETPSSDSFGLASLTLKASDSFVSKTIRECGLREAVNGLIVGIERAGTRHLNPDSSMVLLPDDLLWIVGDRALIRAIR